MDLHYSPVTQCERGAYDSLWRSVISELGRSSGCVSESISLSEVFSFLRNTGFCDEKALCVAQRFAISTFRDPENLDDQTESDQIMITRSAFNSLMRALSLAQRSDLDCIGISDISDTKYADIPLFRCDSVCYRPSSACERSAYEHLWYRVSDSRASTIEGTRVVNFAVKSGLSKETLSRCWSISLNDSGRRSIQKDEFFVFLRCISFVQSTGISDFSRDHISATADRDLPIPDFDDNDYSMKSKQNIRYPSAFYFPQTKFEIQAYNDLWMRASNVRAASASKDADELSTPTASISAVDAVTFVVTSRLQRSILKALWAICSPTAGPVKDTRISREQFNVLLRGISLAQQYPMQAITADSINRSAMVDLRLPCFEFQDNMMNSNHDLINISSPPKGPRPPPLPPKPSQPVALNPTGPRTPQTSSNPHSRSASMDSQTSHADKSFSTMTASPNRNAIAEPSELLVNLDSSFATVPLRPTTVTSLSRNGSLGSMPTVNSRGSNGGSNTFTPTIVDSILESMCATPVATVRGGSIILGPDTAARAGSIGPMVGSKDTDIPGQVASKPTQYHTAAEPDSKYNAVHPGGAVVSGNSPQGDDLQSRLCVCGDTVERFKPDCVRLRCKCMIHTGCLAQYIKSQLDDATSISGEGIRCCYWHSCHSYISMDDVDKFSAFIGKAQRVSNADSQPLIDLQLNSESESVPNFGSNEVDKFTRYAVAASFDEKDLVYCPSCSTPFWVDEDFTVKRVFCQNHKCGQHFCRSCQVIWHHGMDCNTYQLSVASDDKLSHHYVAATSKRCPSCAVPFTHYHGHSCHHISPVGIKGGGCPACHVHFCYACLSTAEDNIKERGDRKSCRCPKGKWSTFCESVDINRFLILDPYPHDSRCGCPICPDCRYQKPCGGLGYSGSSCDGTCVVCTGLVQPGPLEIVRRER